MQVQVHDAIAAAGQLRRRSGGAGIACSRSCISARVAPFLARAATAWPRNQPACPEPSILLPSPCRVPSASNTSGTGKPAECRYVISLASGPASKARRYLAQHPAAIQFVRRQRPGRSRSAARRGTEGHAMSPPWITPATTTCSSSAANGVLLITMNRPEVYNAADEEMHSQLATVWTDVSRDPQTRVAVITGAGRAFSAGGDLAMVQRMVGDYDRTAHMLSEMSDLVYNMTNCEKPIISAINGVAVGAGPGGRAARRHQHLRARTPARRRPRQARRGRRRPRRDHLAAAVRHGQGPYHLLTGEMVNGVEAERIGLVSKVLPREQVLPEALRVADTLATGPQLAIRLTKRALNSWLRTAGPIFDQSAAYEMLTFMGPT